MKISLTFPGKNSLTQWLNERKGEAFSYPEVGASARKPFPEGYDHDHNEVWLGEGDAVWEAAKAAIRSWKMFSPKIAHLYSPHEQQAAGQEVAMLFQFGIWWWSSCRVIEVWDTPFRYGFVYGTLYNHLEKGEEIFRVERREDGSVWYCIEAFSQPRFWAARVAKPLARHFQRQFVRISKEAMVQHIRLNRN